MSDICGPACEANHQHHGQRSRPALDLEHFRERAVMFDVLGQQERADEMTALVAEIDRLRRGIARAWTLCHWVQNRDNTQATYTHEGFHFGNVCPYAVVSEVLQDQPDRRDQ